MTENNYPRNSPSLFWIGFLFLALQTFSSILINTSQTRDAKFFLIFPLISIAFGILALQEILRRLIEKKVSLWIQATASLVVVTLFVLATGFFVFTAIFIGGLPG